MVEIIHGKKYLSAIDASKRFGYTSDYVSKLAREGKISGKKIGRAWFVEERSIENFVSHLDKQTQARREQLRKERLSEYRGFEDSKVAPLGSSVRYGLQTIQIFAGLLSVGVFSFAFVLTSSVMAAQPLEKIANVFDGAVSQVTRLSKDFDTNAITSELLEQEKKLLTGITRLPQLHDAFTTELAMIWIERSSILKEIQSDVVHMPRAQARAVTLLVAMLDEQVQQGARVFLDIENSIRNISHNEIRYALTYTQRAVASLYHESLQAATANALFAFAEIDSTIKTTTKNFVLDFNWLDLISSFIKTPSPLADSEIVASIAQDEKKEPLVTTIVRTPTNVINNITNAVTVSGVSEGDLATLLADLESRIVSRIPTFSGSPGVTIVNTQTFAQSQQIDQLGGVDISGGTITGATISGGSISGVSLSADSLSGAVAISNGGTGTTTAPTYGQLLLGNAGGTYDLVSTSSLGIVGGGGGSSFGQGFELTTNIFGQSSLAPTTTQNLAINGVGTSTFAGGLEAWRAISAPYFHATSTATSTFAGGISISGSIIPSIDDTYSLGDATHQWRDLFVGPGSIYVNGKKVIEDVADTITISTDVDQNLITETSGIGSATTRTTGTGNLIFSSDSGNINVNSISGNLNIGTTGSGLLNLGTVDSGVWQGTAVGVAYGGTGWGTIQANSLLLGNGTGSLATTSAGTNGQTLALVGGVPTWVATTTAGTGLTYDGTSFNLNATGNWTGTFDGQEGAYYLSRANHTGTQAASTISDFASVARGLLSATFPLAYNSGTGAFTYGGLSTSTAGVVGNIPYFSGANTFANIATTSATLSSAFSYSGTLGALVGGSSGTLSLATNGVTLTNLAQIAANSILGNTTGATGNVTAIATSSLFTWTGTGDVVRTTSPTLVTPNLGTPSALVLTNATGLPVSTGISGLGTGVATALGVNVGSAGAFVTFNGALGTPSSGTLTNATGLPIVDGTTGTLTVARGGTGATSLDNLITLGTHTSGNYLATLASSGSITVANSGSESAAATVNLNMGNANTWTALQTFANASTTQLTATSNTYLATAGGTLAVGTTAPDPAMKLYVNGDTWLEGDVFVSGIISGATTIDSTNAIITNASTTNISASYASSTAGFFGALSVGNLSGLLKATSGVVSAAIAGVDYLTDAFRNFSVTTNIFGQSALAPTTTQNLAINGVGTSTFAGGLEAWRQIASPYFHATSTTATSTFAGGVAIETGGLLFNNSSDIFWKGSGGTPVSILEVSGDTTFLRGAGGTPTLRIDASTGTNLMTFLEGGNVGVGTTTPEIKFDVVGRARFASSTNELPTYGTGIEIQYRDVTSESQGVILAYDRSASAYKHLRIDGSALALNAGSGGNVGIGLTNGTSKLEVAGSGANNAGARATYEGTIKINEGGLFSIESTGGLEFKGSVFGSGYGVKLVGYDDGQFAIGTRANSATWSEKLRIHYDGNVGIGTTTPLAKLDVYGNAILSGASRYLNFGDVSGTNGYGFRDNAGTMQVKNNAGSWANIPTSGTSQWTTTGSDIYYNTGNVGIGTTTPQNKLHVTGPDGPVTGYPSVGVKDILHLENNGNINMHLIGGASSGATIKFSPAGSSGSGAGYGQVGYEFANNALVFATNQTERLRIDSSGYVGIGTTTPTQLLHVYGSTPFINITPSASGELSGIRLTDSSNNGQGGLYYDATNDLLKLGRSISTSATNGFAINSSGNVGIGTTTPTGKLDIAGNGATRLRIDSSDGVTGPYLELTSESFQGGVLWYDTTNSLLRVRSGVASDIVFDPAAIEKVRITTAGNVGIGTSSPTKALEIYGTTANSSRIRLDRSGSIAEFATLSGSAILAGASSVSFYTGSGNISVVSERLRIDSSGNVGIGTTGPTSRLHVATSTAAVGNNVNMLTFQNTGAADGINNRIGLQPYTGTNQAAINLIGNSLSNFQSAIAFETGGSNERMRIDTSGNVGIGTTSPTQVLNVQGTNNAFELANSGNSSIYTSIYNNTIRTNFGINGTTGSFLGTQTNHRLDLRTNNTARLTIDTSGSVGIGATSPAFLATGATIGLNIATTSSSGIAALRLETGTADYEFLSIGSNGNFGLYDHTGGAYRFYVDNDGDVGIGATSLQSKLHVRGQSGIIVDNTDNNFASVGTYAQLSLGAASGNTYTRLQSFNTGGGAGGALSLNPLGGNVGIGTTSPNRLLTVSGIAEIGSGSEVKSYSGAASFTIDSGTSGNDTYIVFEEANVMRWRVFNIGSDDRFAILDEESDHGVQLAQDGTSWAAASDRRLKENVETLSILDRLENYRAVSFDWKGNGTRDIGVIAQELYEVFPELVLVGDDIDDTPSILEGSAWSVTYDRLGALALQGVKEIYELIIENTKKIAELFKRDAEKDAKIAELEARLASLEAAVIAGVSGQGAGGSGQQNNTSEADTTAPVVTVQGNNPAHVDIGTAYVDLGATMTDAGSPNVGIHTFLDGVEVQSITIDTSEPGEFIVVYRATDAAGNVGEATRTIIVGEGIIQEEPVEEVTPESDPAPEEAPSEEETTPEEEVIVENA